MAGATPLDARHYSLRSLRYHWRVNLAVMLGVVVGTAVLTGALIVGDSVRHSLRRLTLERLGLIDEVLLADHFFSSALTDRLQLDKQPLAGVARAVPIVLLEQTTIERSAADTPRRAGQVTLVGCGEEFWGLSNVGAPPARLPKEREIVLNRPLADELQAQVGDRVVVRLPRAARIAGDSPLGEKTDTIRSLAELEVIEILPATGLGRFSLRANQALPRTAFLSDQVLQQALEQPDQVNALLIAGPVADRAPADEQLAALRRRIAPSLDDAGLRLKQVSLDVWPEGAERPAPVFEYLSLSTDTMMFSPAAEQAVTDALSGLKYQPVLTYLANSISVVAADTAAPRAIPYSTVASLDGNPELTPLIGSDGHPLAPLGDDDIVLNRWAADDLAVKPGERIRLSYFAPETTHGQVREETHEFTLKAIVPLQPPQSPYLRGRPARYAVAPFRTNDPDLTPEVPGITDQESIDNWDPPFPFDPRRIRKPQDEEYWDQYRTTPKAFVSKRTGEQLWGSRFGRTTSYRIVGADEASLADVQRRLEAAIAGNLEAFGFALLHVKADGLLASRGTTPFNVLFLGFSLFIIAAALMLVCLLFRLSLEQRAGEAGLLLAVGLTGRGVSKLFLLEGLLITLIGMTAGTVLGVAYAALMIAGLRSWWLEAVVTPFLELHVGRLSLVLGALLGAAASLLTIRLTVMGLRKVSLRNLLARQLQPAIRSSKRRRRVPGYVALGLWLIAVVAAVAAVFLQGEAQAGAFFSAGASALAAILLQVRLWFTRPLALTNLRQYGFSLRHLVLRNLGRNAGRSTLTLGLMATACFLIVAISAFRLSPTSQGTGGFQLLAQSDVPIFDDLNDPQARQNLLGDRADVLAGTSVMALRLQDGDDASCRNLYQAQRPRMLGVTPEFVRHFDQRGAVPFAWAGSAAEKPAQESDQSNKSNPWHLLEADADGAIPVILDKNTATYSLHLYGGVGQEFELDYGPSGRLRFQVVGLLANSVLQGTLVISQANLLRHFPDVSGYRYFLIATAAGQQDAVRGVLEDAFRDQGFQATDSGKLLADLLAVQNTYLSTFQSLGGLGLLLGTFGLMAVQLRNVFERRAELALLRATGFSQRRLGWLVMCEHLALLLGGLGIGVAAALVTVLPHAWTTDVHPPWRALLGVLATVLAVGLVTGYLALRPVARAPVLTALRGE